MPTRCVATLQKDDVEAIEQVQKRAIKIVISLKNFIQIVWFIQVYHAHSSTEDQVMT